MLDVQTTASPLQRLVRWYMREDLNALPPLSVLTSVSPIKEEDDYCVTRLHA